MTFNWPEIDIIDGWLTLPEAEMLYHLARKVDDTHMVVEIGSWKGKSTTALCQSGRHVMAIDWFKGSPETPDSDTYAEFKNNLRNYTNYTTIVAKSTDELPQLFTGQIGLLFIDGEHSYEAVKKDWEIYSPKVVPGGFVVFHDAVNTESGPNPWPEVTRFTDELMKENFFPEHWKVDRCLIVKLPGVKL